MECIGVFFKLKAGKAEDYKQAHKDLWKEMNNILEESGIRNYSIWNLGEMLFSYYEVEDRDKMEHVFHNSEVYKKWRDYMEEFIYLEPGTGQKEWFMDMVFYKE